MTLIIHHRQNTSNLLIITPSNSKSMKIFDKEYEYVKDGDQNGFLIDGKDGSEYRSQSFYKYYAFDEHSVDALTHLYVYATHPCQFNDPFDCAEELIKFDDMESIRILWDFLFPKFAETCQYDRDIIEYYSNSAYRTLLYIKWGILCLSSKYDDIAMWAAYSNHKGFCVEFDVSHFPFKMTGPFPINYQEKLISYSIKDITVPLAAIVQTNVKHKCWKHEEEWRLLLECPADFYMEPFGYLATELKKKFPEYHNRKFKYTLRSLKSVCLGMKFFDGIHSVITDYEKEYVATNEMKNDILSFLSLSKIPTYVLDTNELEVVRVPIEITQIRNDAYHINIKL